MHKTINTLLVTGCAGFIGSNFCRLYEREFQIIGLDNLGRSSHLQNVSSKIQFDRADITSEHTLEEIFEAHPGIQGVINFAAESCVDHSLADDSQFWATNVMGVRNLARVALKKKIRLLQVSTDEVYGSNNGMMAFETNSLNPRNPYAASKAAAELLLKSYGEAYGLDFAITRGSNTLGPRQSMDKVIPKAIVHFLNGKPFPLFKTPAKRMWLSVADHCRAIMTVFQKGISGQVYNVSPEEDHEIETADLIEQIRSIIGRGSVQLVDDRAAYDLRYFISSRKIRNELGWESQKNLCEILQTTVAWYLNNPDWIKNHPTMEGR